MSEQTPEQPAETPEPDINSPESPDTHAEPAADEPGQPSDTPDAGDAGSVNERDDDDFLDQEVVHRDEQLRLRVWVEFSGGLSPVIVGG